MNEPNGDQFEEESDISPTEQGTEPQATPYGTGRRRRNRYPMYEGPSGHMYGHQHLAQPWPGAGLPGGYPSAGYGAPYAGPSGMFPPAPVYGAGQWGGFAAPTGAWPWPGAGGYPYQGMPYPWPGPTAPGQPRWQPGWLGPGRPAPSYQVPQGPYAGVGPRRYRRSDERIREDICETLTRDPELDASDIDVQVQNGEATLTGTVDSRQAKRRAEDDAWWVPGVRDVLNQLRIQPAAAPAPGRARPALRREYAATAAAAPEEQVEPAEPGTTQTPTQS